MTDPTFIPGDTWEPLVNIPFGLDVFTGKWLTAEELFPIEKVVDLDELLELTE